MNTYTKINFEEAKRMLDSGKCIMFDVRTDEEFFTGHAEGAVNFDVDTINADTAAAQIAIALKAEKLVSMTDIAGLLRDKDDESTLIPEVEVSEIEGYKSAGIIAGGMIPKIGGMADAIYQGVHEAVIIDGRVPHSILLELFSNRGSGTRFYRRSHQE